MFHPLIQSGPAWYLMTRFPNIIHKGGLCSSSRDINRLMMMMKVNDDEEDNIVKKSLSDVALLQILLIVLKILISLFIR
jgi:hypothetical protein